jgi:hypothetical protein
VLRCLAFSLASAFRSTASTAGCPTSFGGFVAESHTRPDRCVRFAPAVAGVCATLATGGALPLTRAGP